MVKDMNHSNQRKKLKVKELLQVNEREHRIEILTEREVCHENSVHSNT